MKIGIAGASGRMGQTLVREIAARKDCTLASASEQPGGLHIGRDAGSVAGIDATDVLITDNPRQLFAGADAVIDFSSPESSLAHAKLAAEFGKALIIGTTGFTEAQQKELRALGQKTVILWSPNMSLGVNLLQGLVQQAAGVLGEEFDIEIVEMHHRHKVDAPSGTALALGEAAAKGRGKALSELRTALRDGITGERKAGSIGFASLRGGDVVGDHTVIFAGAGERLELAHKAEAREIFARGAIRAALWTKGQKPGFYSIRDVLAL